MPRHLLHPINRPAGLPQPPRSERFDRHAALIARALAYVDLRLDQDLSADTLADRAAMSRHHFHRMFRAHVGCSVGSYVSWRRLQRACALLVSGDEPVLDVALAVGFESAQALAKALRRELDTTPTAMRRGDGAAWKSLLVPGRVPSHLDLMPPSTLEASPTMQTTRFTHLPDGLQALTATARGMVDNTMTRAAQAAFGELVNTLGPQGLMPRVASSISIVPDDPQGPDDPHCRYVAGVIFGYDMATDKGACEQPDVALSGTLAWQALVPGRYAVFTHLGPYAHLGQTWRAIYRDWLPVSGEKLRDAPPMELCINSPRTAKPEDLHTEIWIPVQEAD
jgi:AraC family transcriptional regulator